MRMDGCRGEAASRALCAPGTLALLSAEDAALSTGAAGPQRAREEQTHPEPAVPQQTSPAARVGAPSPKRAEAHDRQAESRRDRLWCGASAFATLFASPMQLWAAEAIAGSCPARVSFVLGKLAQLGVLASLAVATFAPWYARRRAAIGVAVARGVRGVGGRAPAAERLHLDAA